MKCTIPFNKDTPMDDFSLSVPGGIDILYRISPYFLVNLSKFSVILHKLLSALEVSCHYNFLSQGRQIAQCWI